MYIPTQPPVSREEGDRKSTAGSPILEKTVTSVTAVARTLQQAPLPAGRETISELATILARGYLRLLARKVPSSAGRELYGEEPRGRHKVWLFRRLAWRIQELAYGGLSERAKKRLEELMPTAELALRVPRNFLNGVEPLPSRQVVDSRIPPPGTVLLRAYKRQKVALTILEDGFEWEGRNYGSLSAIAKEVTGSHWNGLRFFNLDRKKEAK